MLGPIFAREWVTVGRPASHYVARVVSLGGLWVVGITAWQATVGFARTATLGETARFGLLFFQIVAFLQLTVVMFFAALSAASTIAQEKDRRTFVLLLLTDMRDWEIVLGKMLGSLLPIALLVLGGVPIFFMLLLLGGIDPEQVVQALVVLAATALGAGSLGGLIALWRDRTYQALALSVLLLVLYLCLTRILAVSLSTDPDALLACIDPFAVMQAVLQGEQPTASLAPAYWYGLTMLGLAVLLNGVGIARLRVWNPSGEPIMQRESPEQADEDERDRQQAHAAPGKARAVWANPIAWREIRTRAYGRRPLLVKAAYAVVLGLICWFSFSGLETGQGRIPFASAYGLVPVLVLSLLLVAAQAVTSITSERDARTLDLLLVTDLTPREFIFGKLAGILYNTKEFLLPPLVIAAVYAGMGLLATPPRRHPEFSAAMNTQALVTVWGGMLVLLLFAMVLGVHVALRNANSRVAITNTLGTIFFLLVGTIIAIYIIIINSNFESQWLTFLLFVGVGVGGLWYVLSGDRPSGALTLASVLCPAAMFYCILNILVANPGSEESTDPLLPFLVIVSAFGFAIAAMMVPMLSEFDVALGRTQRDE
jgi:ABC-type Na+ efflux pump permease subunit